MMKLQIKNKFSTAKLFLFRFLFVVFSLACFSQAHAAEINTANYDIYYGDINNDGIKDIYFAGKPKIIILSGDIALPIVIGYSPSYVLYSNGSAYTNPVLYKLDPTVFAQNIQSGALVQAQLNTDFFLYTNSVSGLPEILLRGADINSPSVMLLSYAAQDLPLLMQNYPSFGLINLSDRNQTFSLVDKNGDGFLDLVSGNYAYLSDSSGIPAANNLVNANVFVANDTYITIYDVSGRALGTISPDPDGNGPLKNPATRTTYNATTGLVDKVETGVLNILPNDLQSTPSGWSNFSVISTQVFTYDTYGRKVTTTSYDKNLNAIALAQVNYDNKSHVYCQTTRMNPAAYGNLPDACSLGTQGAAGPDRITRTTYNDIDQVTQIEKAVGTSLAQVYVTNTYTGNLLASQTDANGNRTELRYVDGLLKRMVYPSPTAIGTVNEADYVEFGYDANGNKTSERKRNGKTINFVIDKLNRVIAKNYVNTIDTKQSDVYYDYDLRNLQLSSLFNSTAGVGITNTFDGFGRLKTSTNNMGATSRMLTSDYDDNGNRKQLTHADGQKFSYTFDGLNRVAGVSDSTNFDNNLLAVNYQTNGRRLNITRTNGVVTSYQFNNGVQLDSFSQTFSSASNNLINSFTFNPAGQIVTLTQSNSGYFYIGNDNRTGVYSPDGLNRYTTVNGVTQTYDANSNLTNDGVQAYTYDDENHLLSATTISSGVQGSFVYDPSGRLFQSTIKGVTRQYLYDNNALVAEYDGSNVLQKRYVHGDQVDEPWVEYNGSTIANRIYLHSDHQGSVIALSDNAGNVTAKFAYDTYGIPANNNSDTFGYTGQVYFKDLGLNYYKARFYSPKLGRFLQTDPIGYKDQMNLYAYVGNDPLNNMDPSGEHTFGISGGLNLGEFGGGAVYSVGIIADLHGNIGIQFTTGAGFATPGVSATGTLNYTGAERAEDTNGWGTSYAGEVGDGVVITGGVSTGDGYKGTSWGGGVGLEPGASGSVMKTYTSGLYGNISDVKDLIPGVSLVQGLYSKGLDYFKGDASKGASTTDDAKSDAKVEGSESEKDKQTRFK